MFSRVEAEWDEKAERGSFSKLVRKSMKRYHEGYSYQINGNGMDDDQSKNQKYLLVPHSL